MGGLRVEVLRDAAAWDRLEPAWRGLFAVAPAAAPTLHWLWQRHWWEIYGPEYAAGPAALRLLLAWRGDQLVGALPLYLAAPRHGRPVVLRLLSTGEDETEETCADWLDILAAPDAAAEVEAEFTHCICRELAAEAGELDFQGMSRDSSLARMVNSLKGCNWWADERSLGPCWQADVSHGLEAYLEQLSRTTRQKCRKMLRAAERGEARLELAATREAAHECFDQLIALHQERWANAGKPGAFAAERFTRFHRALVNELELGTELLLSRLQEGDRPVVVKYGFRVGTKVDCYQAGTVVDGSCATKSPGMTGYLLLIAELEHLGIRCVDLLLGDAPHKVRLCKPSSELLHVRLARPGLRFGLHLLRKRLQQRRLPVATDRGDDDE